ncbi:hypothetical protein H4R23_005265 [Coemansia sp. Cherry 401B]|nr:hypothetical protein IWW54_002544 [Coemansia sp. RSA 2705]KAJ2318977.1 hypothetical protein IWW52_002239 [Coemansia sp. RSA 2704]KAJ2717604.1 hypothetical protein H4R23_005265 [Coemansia sp. Cherry 401B]
MRFAQKSGLLNGSSNAVESDKPPTHLLILVPGTGPQSENEKPKGSFVKKAKRFREMLKDICEREFSHTGACVEMVPILYHADLHRMHTTKPRMDKVTLPSIPWIRTIDNERIGDILYYYSAFHGHQLLKMIIEKLNRAYRDFRTAHPGFAGQIDLVAHSLGGLISYEILYMMHMRKHGQVAGGVWESVRYRGLPDLEFTPNRLFSMGSPHGGTLVFRHLTFDEYMMGNGFHNIFHPYDPFGYRTEPLADCTYADVAAVPITGLAASSRSGSFGQQPTSVQKRRSLGNSMADIGKTFVDAMVAPVTLSTSMLRAAKTTVTAPISASLHGSRQGKRPRAGLLWGGASPSDEQPGSHHRRRSSLSRLLPSLSKSLSFRQRTKSETHTIEQRQSPAAFSYSSSTHMAATLSMFAQERRDSPRLRAFTIGTHHSDSSASSTSSLPVNESEGHSESDSAPRVLRSGSQSLSDMPRRLQASDSSDSDRGLAEPMDDMMIGQLMHIFSLSRPPPDRSQQMAEAQGLPLSSRIMALRHDTELHPAQTESPSIQQEELSESDDSDRPDVRRDRIKRANTLPLTLADGRRRAQMIAGSSSSPSAQTKSEETQEQQPPPAPTMLGQTPGRSATASVATPSVVTVEPAAEKQTLGLPYTERMDYIVPFTKGHLQSEYWLGFQAHFSYWTSRDVVHHILHHAITNPVE